MFNKKLENVHIRSMQSLPLPYLSPSLSLYPGKHEDIQDFTPGVSPTPYLLPYDVLHHMTSWNSYNLLRDSRLKSPQTIVVELHGGMKLMTDDASLRHVF